MSATTAWALIGFAAALMLVGTVMLWASAPRTKSPTMAPTTRRRARAARRPGGWVGALTRTSVVCGVIMGVQWAVLTANGPGPAWVAVLWLPAFLAAATVARLLAVMGIGLRQWRRARVLRRHRRCHR
jgi:hypothetical protein